MAHVHCSAGVDVRRKLSVAALKWRVALGCCSAGDVLRRLFMIFVLLEPTALSCAGKQADCACCAFVHTEESCPELDQRMLSPVRVVDRSNVWMQLQMW